MIKVSLVTSLVVKRNNKTSNKLNEYIVCKMPVSECM
jgi:hypothetical protein